ncbi:MAG: hypothetical protein V1932_07065 [Chloroflexota bacterium]
MKVKIVFYSMYGHIYRMAEAVAQGVRDVEGAKVELLQDLPPPRVSQQDRVVNSLLSPGCVIKGRVENSIPSPGVWVDEQAEVRNSVLMPNVFVGYPSVVDTCIIDEGVNIGKLCYIGFGKSLLPGNSDITILGREVTVPPHTAIRRNCTVSPHVDSSSFRDSLITSGSISYDMWNTCQK